jgi:hypothetical protein
MHIFEHIFEHLLYGILVRLVDMMSFQEDMTTHYHHDTAKADHLFFVYAPHIF